MTIAEQLRAGATLIRERGLARGTLYDGKKYCALGALTYAQAYGHHTQASDWLASDWLATALNLPRQFDPYNTGVADTPGMRVAAWSNLSASAEDVATGMEFAALLWDEAQKTTTEELCLTTTT